MTGNEEWLQRMGALTAAHRAARAAKLLRRAKQRLWAHRFAGFSDIYAKASGHWYRARAVGQTERIQRVADCGTETLEIMCVGCGQKHERRSGCRIHLLCFPCRAFAAARKRAIFLRAREVTIAAARRRGMLEGRNRWSEKFLTLTTPHFRINRFPSASNAFFKRGNASYAV